MLMSKTILLTPSSPGPSEPCMAHAVPASAHGPESIAGRDAVGHDGQGDETAEAEAEAAAAAGLNPAILGSAPDPKHLCCHCCLLLRTPVQTQCGHRYCQACLAQLVRQRHVTCAKCTDENVFDPHLSILDDTKAFHDRAAQREIDCLSARCINEGCPWTGTVKEYWSLHEELCEFSTLPCPFQDVGCTAKVSRGELSRHEETAVPLHLRLLLAPLASLRSALLVPDRFALENGDAGAVPQRVGTVDSRVRKLEELLDRLNINGGDGGGGSGGWNKADSGINSASLASISPRRGQAGAAKGGRKKGAAAAAAAAAPAGGGAEEEAGAVVLGRLARVERMLTAFENIVKVLDRETERVAVAQRETERQRREEQQQLHAAQAKMREVERQLAAKEAALAELRGRLLSLEAATFDGVFLWKISSFRQRSRDASEGRNLAFYSPAFYTSQHGYKMCLRLYPNGDGAGRGTHLSLFFVIMKGDHDALLPWPFKYKVTMMLLDQDRREHVIDAFRPDVTSSSFQRPVGELNVASGCPLFCPLARLQGQQRQAYVRDDTIFIRCIVETDGV
ncbi:TNF receptor-associated factor 2-like isoform X1 [Petromyzon marinus]|uniref:TNF receptor-associated factor 2-like isoform X1 n=2 Tax=Petromyzon marinus TaxID=7757 RepID=UPI003F6FF776